MFFPRNKKFFKTLLATLASTNMFCSREQNILQKHFSFTFRVKRNARCDTMKFTINLLYSSYNSLLYWCTLAYACSCFFVLYNQHRTRYKELNESVLLILWAFNDRRYLNLMVFSFPPKMCTLFQKMQFRVCFLKMFRLLKW